MLRRLSSPVTGRALALALSAVLALPACLWAQPAAPAARDPYKDIYAGYVPPFINLLRNQRGYGDPFQGWTPDKPEEMKLSSEPEFFTLTNLDEDTRAIALVEAALKKEQDKQYREALKIYQLVIEKYPRTLYRVSQYGVFVPTSQYCQRRILGFPAKELGYYRTMYDAPAAEAFEQARRQYSLLGLSDVIDNMLATSYGGRAVTELGNAALDSGHYLAALEYLTTVRDFFPDPGLHTPELDLKIAYCRRMLSTPPDKTPQPAAGGGGRGELDPIQLQRLRQVVSEAALTPQPFESQLASDPNVASDDYTLMPPTTDPLGLTPPTWNFTLPGSRRDLYVYSQPVMTGNSVIYRHKNIVYCRSILNGELRWTNDLGGRAVWQNFNERQYPQEDVLVQDGRVFTVISKAGPSLVALDEVTGQLKWAYGPMVASTPEEAKMRFEAAPAGGPRTVFAGYVLDNIEGETHTDSEYGVIAFDSTTGRVQWRTPVCTLAPGKFAGGFAEHRRNRIRSFTSPPLYHQGTVYYCTNAGAICAMDSLSGRVKWLMRYPYWPGIHDATRQFGGTEQYYPVKPHMPMFWYNQRPLLIGDRVYFLPVDTSLMLCLDRRNGKVVWCRPREGGKDEHGRPQNGGVAYLLGQAATGELVFVYSQRWSPVHLLDPATGKETWVSPDLIAKDDSPVMSYRNYCPYAWAEIGINNRWFSLAARPTLTQDNKVYVPTYGYLRIGSYGLTIGWAYHMGVVDLKDRKVLPDRRYLTGEVAAVSSYYISSLIPDTLKSLEEVPNKNDQIKEQIRQCKAVIGDVVPQNRYGPFMPFSRVTFERYGVPFELRMDPRSIQMVYDRDKVKAELARRTGPEADFARAELAVADARYADAAALLNTCLATMSSEDLDFRAAVNQQLYGVHERLARQAIRSGRSQDELNNALGMSRTCSTLAEEIETLFAVSEAYERRGDLEGAGRALRTIISTYGNHEYPVSPLVEAERDKVLATAAQVLDRAQPLINQDFFGRELGRTVTLMKKGLPLYLSTVSPLPRTLTARAGELASARLMQLQKAAPEFAASLSQAAARELGVGDGDELLQRLWEFPGTQAAQQTLEKLMGEAAARPGPESRMRMWRLADAARISGLAVPEKYRSMVLAPSADPPAETVLTPIKSRPMEFTDEEGAARLVLERRGDRSVRSDLMFIGARVRKRLDNKFNLTAIDLSTGKIAWERVDMRLRGTGAEAGFFEAFVLGDGKGGGIVVVHGLYDVLAFDVATGEPKWQYRVPFDFEIARAVMSGDLLVLSGQTETLALYIPTESANGEVVWQVKELGDVYAPLYTRGDRIVSVRKLPFNVTVRYRATGKLIGRLGLPDLTMFAAHPLLENGPAELPVAHSGELLVVSDGFYYIMVDTDRLAVLWKRLIDSNDMTREPAMRFALSPKYLAVTKEDYDQKMIYMLDARSGAVLWQRDPKEARGPQPMYDVLIDGERASGIENHPGQGFYLRIVDCATGKLLFRTEQVGYQARPEVRLLGRLYGDCLVARIGDRQNFEVKVFDRSNGKLLGTVAEKGVGPFDVHGHMSATVQAGRVILLSKDKLAM
ncbi:MAG: Outer membrane protein assembly factor BamB [Phycisphaerae bacterium]|nr:Outer membrane protein assembly factor BamB [Phycisphaerae bacterium]